MNSHPNMAKAKSWFTAALRRGLRTALLLGGITALAQGLPEPGIISTAR